MEADGGAGDAPSGMAHVAVKVNGFVVAPGVTAEASFAAKDGTIVMTATADATGRATLDGPAGGMVSVVVTDIPDKRILRMIVVDVGDGDALEFGFPVAEGGTMDVAFPLLSGNPSYLVQSGCASSSGSAAPGQMQLALSGTCTGTWPMVVKAVDENLGPPQYLVQDVTLASGGAVTMTGAWAYGAPFSMSGTGVAAGVPSATVGRGLLQHGDLVTYDGSGSANAGGTVTGTPSLPSGVGDRQMMLAQYNLGNRTVLIEAEHALTDTTFDASLHLPAVTPSDTSWAWSVGPGSADGIILMASQQDHTTNVYTAWYVFAPAESGEMTWPGGEGPGGNPRLVYAVSSGGGGWAAHRPRAAAFAGLYGFPHLVQGQRYETSQQLGGP